MSTSTVTIRHNFETGHRLPHLSGKCQSLHGHSWWAEVTVEAPEGPSVLIEFGALKAAVRDWIDEHLDHGLMLGRDDPLAQILPEFGKVYIFDEPLGWPTVENVARLLASVTSTLVEGLVRAPGLQVTRVEVSETHVNRAGWSA